jgi:hypothetical protein
MERNKLALIFALSLPGYAANIVAASCSYADVNSAMGSATYNDVIQIPPGSCTWTSTLAVTKGLTILGAGKSVLSITASGINNIITYQPDATTRSNDYLFTLRGITFECGTASYCVYASSTSATEAMRVRVIYNTFNGTSGRCFSVGDNGQFYGLISNNHFACSGISIYIAGGQENSWDNFTCNLGAGNQLFIENNTFDANSFFFEGGHGGRYVARFNSITYQSGGSYQSIFDAHGNQPTGIYATMCTEIYRNTINMLRNGTGADMRGGIVRFFDNTFTTSSSNSMQWREEYDDNGTSSPTSNPQPQHISDSYAWNNRDDGVRITWTESDCCTAIAENAEWWSEPSSFNGTVGVGFGTLAARPSTCTVGVGYWATDEGTWNRGTGDDGNLYKCTSTNTWTLYYTPYQYPHDLTPSAMRRRRIR